MVEVLGVPMYSYDFFPVGENSTFSAIQHINEGCINLNFAQVCDPPDLWEGNTQLIDGNDGNTYFYSTYQSWAEAPIHSTLLEDLQLMEIWFWMVNRCKYGRKMMLCQTVRAYGIIVVTVLTGSRWDFMISILIMMVWGIEDLLFRKQ